MCFLLLNFSGEKLFYSILSIVNRFLTFVPCVINKFVISVSVIPIKIPHLSQFRVTTQQQEMTLAGLQNWKRIQNSPSERRICTMPANYLKNNALLIFLETYLVCDTSLETILQSIMK